MEFLRTDLNDGAEETLTIVLCAQPYYSEWLETESPYLVQVTQGAHFAGLFGLDGDAIPALPREWVLPAETTIPPNVVAAVEDGWASGNYTVERIET